MLKISTFCLIAFLCFSMSGLAQVPDSIPPFSKFYSYENGASFSRDSLNLSNKQVFVLYDAGCGHCQELGHELGKSIAELDPLVDYYFIALQEKPLVDGYIEMFAQKLKNHPRVHFLHDPEGEFILKFNPKNFPSTFIYDRKTSRLLFQIDGESKWEKMFPFLKNSSD